MKGIEPLLEIMAKLRDPDRGCPWDLEQSFETVAPYTLEEAYEVDHAIRQGDMDGLREELGDLLFQVVFHARMAEESGLFAFQDVVDEIRDKLVRRHPHVFDRAGGSAAERQITSSEEQTRAWEEYKADERARKSAAGGSDDLFEGIPTALPALGRAVALRKRAAREGVASAPGDTRAGARARQILEALTREVGDDAAPGGSREEARRQVGEMLSACASLARALGVDPEEALRELNAENEARWRAAWRERGRSEPPAGRGGGRS